MSEKLPQPEENPKELMSDREQDLTKNTQSPENFDKNPEEITRENEEFEKRKKENLIQDKEKLTQAEKDLEDIYSNQGDVEESEYENSGKMNKEELEILKSGFEDLADSVKRLYNGLLQRDQEGFVHLIDSENIDTLKASALSLESAIDQKNIQSEELRSAIGRIISSIDYIGDISKRQSVMNEDEDSLMKIATLLRNVEEQCREVFSEIRIIEKEEAKDMAQIMEKLSDKVDGKSNYMGRKIQAFQNYNR